MSLPIWLATMNSTTKPAEVDILIIGGGAAGMSAALAAHKKGAERILIVDRNPYLGGVLRQCIHDGFGLHVYQQSLTGVEFAKRQADEVDSLGIAYLLNTFVLEVRADKTVTLMNGEQGLFDLRARAIIMSMGCRERPRAALLIPGQRCAGVLTAGTAQRYLNIDGYLPGKKIVILGSGDIGLIMARQFVLEDAQVVCVVEIRSFSSGLARNISQCLEDYQIPLVFNSTVVDIQGRERVEAVVVAQVDAELKPIPGTEKRIECDTLLISAGLLPENELTWELGATMCESTGGPIVDESLQTSISGIFSCGNVLHVHDLVDFVSLEGAAAGENAAAYLQHSAADTRQDSYIQVKDGFGISGVTPQRISRNTKQPILFRFRPREVYCNCSICVYAGQQCLVKEKKRIVTPGEMCSVKLDPSALHGEAALTQPLTICLERN